MVSVKGGFCRRLIAEEPIFFRFSDDLVSWSVYRKHLNHSRFGTYAEYHTIERSSIKESCEEQGSRN